MIRFARPPSGFIAQKARRPLRPAGRKSVAQVFSCVLFMIYEIKSLMDMSQPSIGIMVLPSSIFFGWGLSMITFRMPSLNAAWISFSVISSPT